MKICAHPKAQALKDQSKVLAPDMKIWHGKKLRSNVHAAIFSCHWPCYVLLFIICSLPCCICWFKVGRPWLHFMQMMHLSPSKVLWRDAKDSRRPSFRSCKQMAQALLQPTVKCILHVLFRSHFCHSQLHKKMAENDCSPASLPQPTYTGDGPGDQPPPIKAKSCGGGTGLK